LTFQNDQKKKYSNKGAEVHNLKNVDVVIPRNKLVVITDFQLEESSLC
jgi:excinuclease UvrABC ATPase subunit